MYYLCSILPPNLAHLKQQTFLVSPISAGREFRSRLAEWFWLKVSSDVAEGHRGYRLSLCDECTCEENFWGEDFSLDRHCQRGGIFVLFEVGVSGPTPPAPWVLANTLRFAN